MTPEAIVKTVKSRGASISLSHGRSIHIYLSTYLSKTLLSLIESNREAIIDYLLSDTTDTSATPHQSHVNASRVSNELPVYGPAGATTPEFWLESAKALIRESRLPHLAQNRLMELYREEVRNAGRRGLVLTNEQACEIAFNEVADAVARDCGVGILCTYYHPKQPRFKPRREAVSA